MSYISAQNSEKAKEYIESAIKKYELAIEQIKVNNDNLVIDKLIDDIQEEISHLLLLKKNIGTLTSNINSAMSAKEKRMKEEQSQEKTSTSTLKASLKGPNNNIELK